MAAAGAFTRVRLGLESNRLNDSAIFPRTPTRNASKVCKSPYEKLPSFCIERASVSNTSTWLPML